MWAEPAGEIRFSAPDEWTACAELSAPEGRFRFSMTSRTLCVRRTGGTGEGRPFALRFDTLPVLEGLDGGSVLLRLGEFG